MKKTLLSTFIIMLFALINATGQSHSKDKFTAENQAIEKKKAAMQECPGLKEKITAKFGENFQINSSEVQRELKNILADQKNTMPVRKYALYCIYGDDFSMHNSELQNPVK